VQSRAIGAGSRRRPRLFFQVGASGAAPFDNVFRLCKCEGAWAGRVGAADGGDDPTPCAANGRKQV